MLNSSRKKSSTAGKRVAIMMAAACMSFIGIGGISAIFSAPVQASTSGEVRTRLVKFQDLNLASDHDKYVLDRRISKAAKQVCTQVGIGAVIQHTKIRACAKSARSKAWSSVEHRIGMSQRSNATN